MLTLPAIGHKTAIQITSEAALAYAISEFSQQQRPILVLTASQQAAQRLHLDLTFFLKNAQHVLLFPDWETLPYDQFSPHEDIISDRLKTLQRLRQAEPVIVIASLDSILHRLPPLAYLDAHVFSIQTGQKFDLIQIKTRLSSAGYESVGEVIRHGEFAVRGSIIDIFPMGHHEPYRIELFDDEIESIRSFDPDTQKTLEKLNAFSLLPAREYPLTPEAIKTFRSHWREAFEGNPSQCPIYNAISEGLPSPGVEYYLPLFFNDTTLFTDYLAANTLIIRSTDLDEAGNRFWQDVNSRYMIQKSDTIRPALPPDAIFVKTEHLFQHCNQFAQIVQKQNADAPLLAFSPLPEIDIEGKKEIPLHKLQAFLKDQTRKILFCVESAGRREALLTLLKDIQIFPSQFDTFHAFLESGSKLGITTGDLNQGIILTDLNLCLITESDVLTQRVMQRRRRKKDNAMPFENAIRHLAELKINDPVVHIDHGVGRYLGLQTLVAAGIETEFLALQYANDAKLYVPVTALHLISRYSAVEASNAPLHTLGTGEWEKQKRKAQEAANDAAAELLDIYARRAARQGVAFTIDESAYHAFSASFPFEETPDQARAIAEVITDLKAKKPMDRLVCGDVGFGKTEVAMRAAFVVALSGKQVAVLVPTTLLAEQHYESFCDRFADWPLKIEVISRFKTAKAQAAILADLQAGKVDILIGTHKLLQDKIAFPDLGLLIIDEEHRFGVKQKEKLKSIRSEVDILTLTATPIPRTLNMALSEVRDLSIIATPPARRLAIKTFVHGMNDGIIKEAISREIHRGGQVFYLHNDIETIERTAEYLKDLLPEASIGVGHGQLREHQLERVMSDFYHQRFHVLVCTTIIETGIDIPSANTIIIERADKFGLAQLHQLRGRVGRSHHQAYAYLLIPHHKGMTKDAEKRLEAISTHEDLGAGFMLASNDLEIRGAGELLGEGQSGHIHEVGFSLFLELLQDAVRTIKSGKMKQAHQPLHFASEIDLQNPALIPEKYVGDIHTRLVLYKRIAGCEDADALADLKSELIDRFGELPHQTQTLFECTALRLLISPLGIKKIELGLKGGRILFHEKPNIDPVRIIGLIQKEPWTYKLDGADKLRITSEFATVNDRSQFIRRLVQVLK